MNNNNNSLKSRILNSGPKNSLFFLYFSLQECPYCQEFNNTWKNIIVPELQLDGIITKSFILNKQNQKQYQQIKEEFNFQTVPALYLISTSISEHYPISDRTPEKIFSWLYPLSLSWSLQQAKLMIQKHEPNILLIFTRPQKKDMIECIEKLANHFNHDLIQIRRIMVPKNQPINKEFEIHTLPAFIYIEHINNNIHIKQGKCFNYQYLLEWIYRLTYDPPSLK